MKPGDIVRSPAGSEGEVLRVNGDTIHWLVTTPADGQPAGAPYATTSRRAALKVVRSSTPSFAPARPDEALKTVYGVTVGETTEVMKEDATPFTRDQYPLHRESFLRGLRQVCDKINNLCEAFYDMNRHIGWHNDLWTSAPLDRPLDGLLMLLVSEVAEANDGHRTGIPDGKLPQHLNWHVELADIAIRLFDTCGLKGVKLGDMIYDKTVYNLDRPDHMPEARRAKHGKKT